MKKKISSVLLIVVLITTLLAGCGNGADTTSGTTNEVADETAEQEGNGEEIAAAQERDKADAVEEQADSGNDSVVEQPTTDMADREIDVPKEISSVYSSSPVGTNFMYTFDDTLIAGLNSELLDADKAYRTKYYQTLPNLGGWYGKGNEGNVEEVIKIGPDIVLCSGTDQASIEEADELQDKLGIPVVLVDTDFDYMAESYRFLGALLGNQERGEELAQYTEETIRQAEEITAAIPDEEKVAVYYVEEQLGLNTDPSGSPHSRLIDLCGGINVADCEITPGYADGAKASD